MGGHRLQGVEPDEGEESREPFVREAVSQTRRGPTHPTTPPASGIVARSGDGTDDLVRAFLLGIAHEQSSPLGALLANLQLGTLDLKHLLTLNGLRQTETLDALRSIERDLDDAMRMVDRLRLFGDRLKALGRRAGTGEHEPQELLTLASAVANSALQHVVSIYTHSSEPYAETVSHPAPAPPRISGNGISFIRAVVEIVQVLVGANTTPVRAVRILVRTKEERLSLLFEPQLKTSDALEQPTPLDGFLQEHDALPRLNALLSQTNLQALAPSMTPKGCIALETMPQLSLPQ